MTVTQVADMYCDMIGATLNESQREALERLFKTLFDTGFKAGKEDLEPIFQCAHCGTAGQGLQVKTFDDKEALYCKHCIANGQEGALISERS